MGWHHHLLKVPGLWSRGLKGKGVRVAVLDTGVAAPEGLDRDHFEHLEADGSPAGAMDLDGHGTAVASVIASGLDGVLGIAPRAAISSYRVLDAGNHVANTEAALGQIVSRSDIDVVVCAFVLSDVTPRIEHAIRALSNRGTVVVAPAGNDATAASPFPEQTPHAITIAGLDRELDPLPEARLGLWVDCSAPGVEIPALDPDGARIDFGDTSGAAAIVGGIAALVLSSQASIGKRRKLGKMFEGLLKSTARALPEASRDAVGAGLVNPTRMLAVIEKGI